MNKFFGLVLIVVLISSCKKDSKTILYGYEIYPMNEGSYVIYDVTDIFHDVALIPAHDTNQYQIKEVIGEEELDGEGEPFRKLYRYHRLSDTLDWTMQDVWTVKRTSQTLEKVEENKRRISLAFSVSYDRYWNYNALNEDDELTARYENIYEPFSIGSDSYDSTVLVEIENLLTFIEYKRQYDIYAMNVGRIIGVKKDLEILNTDTTDIKKGTELFYTAIDFGLE